MKQKTLLSIKLSILVVASTALFSSCANNTGVVAGATTGTTAGSTTVAEDSAPSIAGNYPVARQMVNPETGQPIKDHYISPYRPYNPIVAKNFKSGQLAGDPSTMKVDPKTGKPNEETIKAFRIP